MPKEWKEWKEWTEWKEWKECLWRLHHAEQPMALMSRRWALFTIR